MPEYTVKNAVTSAKASPKPHSKAMNIVLGPELERAIKFVMANSETTRMQDTIRELLMTHPVVTAAAEVYGVDLEANEITHGKYYPRKNGK